MNDPALENLAADEKVNILLVDDRADKLLSLKAMLEEVNQNLVTATSGREALRCLLKRDFAVILLDVNMPIMDGFETAAMIRQRPRSETTPIIFISAVNDTETHVSRGYSLGAVDYMLTPVVPEILRTKVTVFVDLFKKTEQVKKQAEERAEFVRAQMARAAAEAEQLRLAFLAEASNVLASSLEYQETFENLATLAVPRLAEFCVIEAVDEHGVLHPVASKTAKPEVGNPLAKPTGILHRWIARVYQSGKSELCSDLEDAGFGEAADSPELSGYMAIPLRARGRVLGVLTLANTRTERLTDAGSLSLAEELTQRAALALDNAGLYKAARQARLEAESANLAKDRFLAMLSHELRTPLTPVLTTVLSLQGDPDVPETLQPALQMIRRNVELEARLIDDLLDLTRISKGKLHLNLEMVDAHRLLRNALEICEPEIRAKQLNLEVDLAAERVNLEADPARVQQIWWNLIKNAVKFTPSGGKLTVATRNWGDRDGLEVSVSDTGLGIDRDLLPKIFDAFEQGERMRFGGIGLGLAITKALVELHNGQIVAESAGKDQGSKFTLRFPTAAKEAREVSEAHHPSGWTPERRYQRILLVEDHEDTNRSLTRLLRRRGYEVYSAADVESAVEIARQEDFDVLVSDMSLPDGTGLDVIRRISAERHSFLAIALTGFGMEEDTRRSYAAGFHHHLIKPVDLNKLDAAIQQVAVQVHSVPSGG